MNETFELEMNFYKELGKNKKLTLRHPKPGLTEQQIKDAMQTIIDAKIYTSDGEQNYHGIRNARYVTTGVDSVFEEE